MKRVGVLVALSFCLFFLGPGLLHSVYVANTASEAITTNRERYTQIARQVYQGSTAEDTDDLKSQQLYLIHWFHVRGLPIDEGHCKTSTAEQWRELIWYWKHSK